MHRCRSGRAAKIKNTKPGPLAITVTMTSPMPYPPDAASMARATPTMRNNAARIALSKKKNVRPSRSDICAAPERTRPADGRGHDPRLSPSGQGVPPKGSRHVSQPVQLKIGYFAADVAYGSFSTISVGPPDVRCTLESGRGSAQP